MKVANAADKGKDRVFKVTKQNKSKDVVYTRQKINRLEGGKVEVITAGMPVNYDDDTLNRADAFMRDLSTIDKDIPECVVDKGEMTDFVYYDL